MVAMISLDMFQKDSEGRGGREGGNNKWVSFSIHPLRSSLAVYRINYHVAWSYASENLMLALPCCSLQRCGPVESWILMELNVQYIKQKIEGSHLVADEGYVYLLLILRTIIGRYF